MKTILLVDDSRAVRLTARRMLIEIGCTVLEAEDGKQALQVLREHPETDAVLLDWNMPVMDGISMLRALKADSAMPQPHVVMCTTENDMTRILEAIAAGAVEYIMKPFTDDILREKLQDAGVL